MVRTKLTGLTLLIQKMYIKIWSIIQKIAYIFGLYFIELKIPYNYLELLSWYLMVYKFQ